MAEVIKQELGFDAAQALVTLAQLESGLQAVRTRFSSLTKSMGSFNARGDKTDAVLKRLATSSGNAATSMAKLEKLKPISADTTSKLSNASTQADKVARSAKKAGDEFEKTGKKGKKAADAFLVSWQTMARVVGTQLIVRALNAIRGALDDAVTGAVDFQKAVAEISTIGADLGGLENIEDMVLRVSKTFNVDLADTAEAAYQTVSNQIASTEKDVESFLGTAAKFAKVTKTDMATAVSLLSGTLNAFDKDVSQAEDVAAKFFKTIELGRTRADELAAGLGTIAPVARELGIEMEELNAAVVTLSIQGLKTDKVVTQIRGAMQAFLKPTTAMKAGMKELGFETGEQVFAAYDLQEAIQKLIATTDGSAASISQYFPRIRGLTGVMGLAKDETGNFTEAMREQQDALADYDAGYKIVLSTDAETVTKAINSIKKSLTDLFGQKVLAAGASLVRTLNLIGMTEAEMIAVAWDERAKLVENGLKKEAEMHQAAFAEREQLAAQVSATARKGFFEAASAAEEANAVIMSSSKWALDSMLGPIEAAVSGIQKAAAESQKLLGQFADEATSSLEAVQDTVFKRSVGAADDPNVKVMMLRKKSAELSLEAQLKASSATSKADIDAAKQLQASSRAFNDQAFAISKSIKKKYENNKATRDLTEQELKLQKQRSGQVTQDLVLRQDRYQKSLNKGEAAVKSNAKTLAESAREVTAYKTNLDALRKKMEELQKSAAEKDLTPEDQDAKLKEAEKAVEDFLTAYGEGVKKFGESTDPVVKKFFQEIEAADRTVEIETLMTLPDNMQIIFSQIRDAAEKFFQATPVGFKMFADAKGIAIDTPKQVDAAMERYWQFMKDQTAAADEATVAEGKFFSELKKGTDIIDSILPQIKEWGVVSTQLGDIRDAFTGGDFNFDQFEGFRETLIGIADGGQVSEKKLLALHAVITEFLPLWQQAGRPEVDFSKLGSLEAQVAASKEIAGARIKEAEANAQAAAILDTNKAKADAALMTQLQLTQATKDNAEVLSQQPAKVDETDQSANQLKTTQGGITSEVNSSTSGVQQLTAQYDQAKQAAEGVVRATLQIGQAASSTAGPIIKNPGVDFNAHGGRVGYFANGGRGTDNIPAMLSKGEHVTNAKSSRRFFSQLQAMNAGQNPVFKSEGGDTYSTTVGDINVSGTGSPQVVARDVMRAIRREERRGSGR